MAELARGPRHGYELRREIEAATGHTLSNNSLYPRLRQFVAAAAVLRRAEEHEGTPPRHIYSITDVGRELLHDMLAELPEDTGDNAREFMARLVHFDWLTPEEQLRILDARDNILAGDRKRTAILAAARAEHWSLLTLEHGMDRIDWDRAWLADIRAEVEANAGADSQVDPTHS
ncbi:PadR family transcriptional regulator [Streptomyces sp. NPDC051677]|uniref:PadR family transcriptional regulator n=1 Tax=Streptomyces sp. NPDC051677 TaxID=3365669 RepID=UPI0037CFB358